MREKSALDKIKEIVGDESKFNEINNALAGNHVYFTKKSLKDVTVAFRILELNNQKFTPSEIKKELDCSYGYIFRILKKFKQTANPD